MVNVQRLAAVDLSGLGPKIIIPEFVLAVLGAPTLGVLTVVRSRSLGMTALGVALIGLGVNYVPLLIHAIDLVRRSAVSVLCHSCPELTASSVCPFQGDSGRLGVRSLLHKRNDHEARWRSESSVLRYA